MNIQELIEFYKIPKYPPCTVKDVADRFRLDYFQIIDFFREKHVVPNQCVGKSGMDLSQYLVDYYHLRECSLARVAKAFDYNNSSNVHRIMKKNPLYKAHRSYCSAGKRSELIDFIWQPDVKAYQKYLEIRNNYSDRKGYIGVNQIIDEYIKSGEIPTISYNFLPDKRTTTLSLMPKIEESLTGYSRFFEVSKNQIVNCAFKHYLIDDNIN